MFPAFCKIIRREGKKGEERTVFILVLAAKKNDKVHLDNFKGRDYALFSFVPWEP